MRFYYGACFVSDNFLEVHPNVGIDEEVLCLVTNSSLFQLFVNMAGRANFGGGLLKIQTYEVANLLVPQKNFQMLWFKFLVNRDFLSKPFQIRSFICPIRDDLSLRQPLTPLSI